MLDAETWRWAIGGGLVALTGGMAWLMRMVWQAGATLARIEARLSSHGELHDRHSTRLDHYDDRLRLVEAHTARLSGQWSAQ
jgi:hypothetical protein